MHKNLSTTGSGPTGDIHPNTAWPAASSNTNRPTTSSFCRRVHSTVTALLQRISIGATTNAPPMSPSHHVNHTDPARAHVVVPASSRLATPNVALTAVLTRPASAVYRNESRAP